MPDHAHRLIRVGSDMTIDPVKAELADSPDFPYSFAYLAKREAAGAFKAP
jgi:hypothetical protein